MLPGRTLLVGELKILLRRGESGDEGEGINMARRRDVGVLTPLTGVVCCSQLETSIGVDEILVWNRLWTSVSVADSSEE